MTDDQLTRIDSLLHESDEPAWLLIADAGRYDVLETICPDHLRGNLDPVTNGGCTHTTEWFERMFHGLRNSAAMDH